MSTQKRDILILELIKHLINKDKLNASGDLLTEALESNSDAVALVSQNATNVNTELQSIKNSISELKTAIQSISKNQHTGKQTPKVQVAPVQTSPSSHHSNGNITLYQELVKDALQNAEYHMQNLATSTFIAKGNFKDFFLWSGQTSKGVLVILLESQSSSISANILNALAGQIINEIPGDVNQVPRMVNKKIFNFYNKYKDLEQKIVASFVLIDKKSAKISFTGAGTNLFKVGSESKIKGIKGLKTSLGVPNNQFEFQTISLKRGESFYISSIAKLPKLIVEIKGDSSIKKKEKLADWLQKQQKNNVILGLSF